MQQESYRFTKADTEFHTILKCGTGGPVTLITLITKPQHQAKVAGIK